MRTAVILAGGRSTRFGEADKSVSDLAGKPMIRRVADTVAPAVDELVVNCRDDQRAAIGAVLDGYAHPYRFAEDERPDDGPVAGMMTGLDAVDSTYAFVVACDMPFIDPAVAELLFDRARGYDGAVPRLDDGWFQTTQAVYRADAMATACRETLDAGERKILAALDQVEYAVVEEAAIREHASLDTFRNLNTREEFEAAASEFSDDDHHPT